MIDAFALMDKLTWREIMDSHCEEKCGTSFNEENYEIYPDK